MTLLYDSFGVRRVQLIANIWPDLDSFLPNDLSRLLAALNGDEIFTSWDMQPGIGARFHGENWLYDISLSSVLIRSTGFETPEHLRATIGALLEGTRKFFKDRGSIVFYADEVVVGGTIPDDKMRNIGEVVQKRLLTRVTAEDKEDLPGLEGAGLRLVGTTDDFHWHANIEPPHGAYDSLLLRAQIMFFREPYPPEPGADLELINTQVTTTYEFVSNHLRTFSSKLFK